jgi:hypothetical protein
MSDRYINAFINAAYVGSKAPNAPTSAVAAKGNTNAEISFSAPANTGGGAITGYRATSTPGNFTGTAASSPITVNGLTNGTSYTFQVTAINAFGESPGSNVTNAVTPSLNGQRLYTGGSFTFVVPANTFSVSVVCVGAGGAGGYGSYNAGAGGGLRYKNNIAVTPGQSISVVAASTAYYNSSGGDSSFGTNGVNAFYFFAGGGGSGGNLSGGTGSTIGGAADGGGNGGNIFSSLFGGGGAGGYSGNGGNAGTFSGASGSAGTGGGGGGGYSTGPGGSNFSGGGGGVGVLGQGANGGSGTGSSITADEASKNGGGGSGGTTATGLYFVDAGIYGGGGGGSYAVTYGYMNGGAGAVRIIYPATGTITRAFPSTNTGDL